MSLHTTTFPACEFTAWRHIDTPDNHNGQTLIAATVYRHLNRGNHA
jgi:hypothetical protein